MKELFKTKQQITKVNQNYCGYPYGNCTSACVASIIDFDLRAVPNFNQWELVFQRWWLAAKIWCFAHGYLMSDAFEWDFINSGIITEDEVFIAGGQNIKGIDHSVLWTLKDGCIHDPNPETNGLAGIPQDGIYLRKLENIRKPLLMN